MAICSVTYVYACLSVLFTLLTFESLYLKLHFWDMRTSIEYLFKFVYRGQWVKVTLTGYTTVVRGPPSTVLLFLHLIVALAQLMCSSEFNITEISRFTPAIKSCTSHLRGCISPSKGGLFPEHWSNFGQMLCQIHQRLTKCHRKLTPGQNPLLLNNWNNRSRKTWNPSRMS